MISHDDLIARVAAADGAEASAHVLLEGVGMQLDGARIAVRTALLAASADAAALRPLLALDGPLDDAQRAALARLLERATYRHDHLAALDRLDHDWHRRRADYAAAVAAAP